MATVRQRAENRFEVQIRRVGHKTITRTFQRKKDATKFGKKIEGDIELGIYQDTTQATLTTLPVLNWQG